MTKSSRIVPLPRCAGVSAGWVKYVNGWRRRCVAVGSSSEGMSDGGSWDVVLSMIR